MGVLEPHATLARVEPMRARVPTPLGAMAFEALAFGESMPAAEAHVGESGTELRRYRHSLAEVELLLLPFVPSLPEGMRVDACVAAVWRILAKKDGAAPSMRAVWEPGARIDDGGANCGEHLTAITWYGPDAQATLGTPDEEALSYAAEDGHLPARLSSTFLADGAEYARIVGERDGLQIVLPPLFAGETVQAHMVLAWRTGEMPEHECSAWFAVDVAPKEVSRMVDEALGKTP